MYLYSMSFFIQTELCIDTYFVPHLAFFTGRSFRISTYRDTPYSFPYYKDSMYLLMIDIRNNSVITIPYVHTFLALVYL